MYQFKGIEGEFIDFMRICNEAPLDQDAIVVTNEDKGYGIVLLRASWLFQNVGKGRIVDQLVAGTWGYPLQKIKDGQILKDGFRGMEVKLADIGKFVSDYRKIKNAKPEPPEPVKKPKRTTIKVHYV